MATSAERSIATLYATVLQRAPDADGFAFWLDAHAHGASLAALAESFLGTPEGQAAHPAGPGGEAFVANFYTAVFGRDADAAGLRFWADALDAMGGAGSTAARAQLMAAIIDIVSTPLAERPEGMDDAAYAQAVTDRARVANQAEFGVYFAVELGSNDIGLARGALALITDDPASLDAAREAADPTTPPVNPPVPPVVIPAITGADDAAAIARKLDGYAGKAATADVTDMQAAQLQALATRLDKLGATGLTGALTLTVDVAQTDAAALLAKYSGTEASAVATGMAPAYLATLAATIDTFADGAIAGELVLDVFLSTAQIDALLGAKLARDAVVTVDADGLDTSAIATVATHDQVSSIVDLPTLFLSAPALTAAVLMGLVAKADAIAADLSGATGQQLAALAGTDKVADGALTGSFTLDTSLDAGQLAWYLSAVVADDATITVDATGMDGAQLTALAGGASQLADGGIGGTLVIPADVSVADANALLAKYAGTTAEVHAASYGTADLIALSTNAAVATIVAPQLAFPASGTNWGATGEVGAVLAKSVEATVNLANAADRARKDAIANSASIADGGITGAYALQDPTVDWNSVLPKFADSAVVTLGLSKTTAPALVLTLFQHADKIDQVSVFGLGEGSFALLDGVSLAPLLGKGNGQMYANLTGATAAQLKEVADYGSAFAATASFTGSFALDQGFSAAQLGVLTGARVASEATVTVNAASMTGAQLDVVAAGAAQIDTITNLALDAATFATLSDTSVSALLGKATGAAVDLTGGRSTLAGVVLAHLDSLAPNGITGNLALTSASVDASSFATLFQKIATSANVSVDAANMDVTQVVALFGNAAKIDTLANLAVPAGTFALLPSDIGTLFTLQNGIKADLSGASSAQLQAVAQYVNQIADGGLTGSYTLSHTFLDVYLTSLLGARVADAADVTVDAGSMNSGQLAIVAANIGKVDTITNLSLTPALLAGLDALTEPTDDPVAALLGKATGAGIDLTGADQARVNVVLENVSHFANGGITGTSLSVSSDAWGELASADRSVFSAKLASGTALSVIGGDGDDVIDLTGLGHAVTVNGGAGADVITLGSGVTTIQLGGRGDWHNDAFSTTDTDYSNIDRVWNVEGGFKVQLSTAADAYADDVQFHAGTVVAAGMETVIVAPDAVAAQGLAAVYAAINDIGTVAASTSDHAVYVMAQVDGMSDVLLFVNDGTAGIDEHDFVTVLGGTVPNPTI